MNFNISELDEEVKESLRLKIVEVSKDFIKHRLMSEFQITRGEGVNKNALELQAQTVSLRVD